MPLSSTQKVILGSLVAGGTILGATAASYLYKRRTVVSHVEKIILYPIKSCGGVELQEAVCTSTGFCSGIFRDRQFMVVQEDGEFVSARTSPTLSLIKLRLGENSMSLSAPGMSDIVIDINKIETKVEDILNVRLFDTSLTAVECSTEISKWFSEFLSKSVKLVYFNDTLCTRPLEELAPDTHNRMKRSNPDTAQVLLADGYPYLLLNDASCDSLNTLLKPEDKVTYRTFRPNIVMKTDTPYSEDRYRYISIGNVEFYNEKPCGRCRFVNVSPDTGTVNPRHEPLNTLYKTRVLKDYDIKAPCMGANLILESSPGVIAVGDPVYA